MKRIVMLVFLLNIVFSVKAQNMLNVDSADLRNHYYLLIEKSARQKKTGKRLLTAGAGFGAVSVASTLFLFLNFRQSTSSQMDTYGAVSYSALICGSIAALSSIPFLRAAGKNQRSAARLKLLTGMRVQLIDKALYQPATGVVISF